MPVGGNTDGVTLRLTLTVLVIPAPVNLIVPVWVPTGRPAVVARTVTVSVSVVVVPLVGDMDNQARPSVAVQLKVPPPGLVTDSVPIVVQPAPCVNVRLIVVGDALSRGLGGSTLKLTDTVLVTPAPVKLIVPVWGPTDRPVVVARTVTVSVSVVVVLLAGVTSSQALLSVADQLKVPPPGLVTFIVPILVQPVPLTNEPVIAVGDTWSSGGRGRAVTVRLTLTVLVIPAPVKVIVPVCVPAGRPTVVARRVTASVSVVVVPRAGVTSSQALLSVAVQLKVPPPGLVTDSVPIVVQPAPCVNVPLIVVGDTLSRGPGGSTLKLTDTVLVTPAPVKVIVPVWGPTDRPAVVARTVTISVSVVVVLLAGITSIQALLSVADQLKVPPPRLVTLMLPIVIQPVPLTNEPVIVVGDT
jgi:hypothetical protein